MWWNEGSSFQAGKLIWGRVEEKVQGVVNNK